MRSSCILKSSFIQSRRVYEWLTAQRTGDLVVLLCANDHKAADFVTCCYVESVHTPPPVAGLSPFLQLLVCSHLLASLRTTEEHKVCTCNPNLLSTAHRHRRHLHPAPLLLYRRAVRPGGV